MDYQRILRVANGFFLFTGYQIRSFDNKSRRYHLSLWSVLYFLILFLGYIICFEQHFEKSAFLKIMQDLSPFLKNLIIVQIWLGLKAFVFCIIEWRSLTKVLNDLVAVLVAKDETTETDRRGEILAYIMFFSPFVVALSFGLYIAIEMHFELPPVGHIMIGCALFIPHFTLAGSLRLHNLCLWLLRKELENFKRKFLSSDCVPQQDVIVEIINPVLSTDLPDDNVPYTVDAIPHESFQDILKGVQSISNYFKSTNIVLQRQMCILNGLNFNCLLAGIYSRIYFHKTWSVIFTGRNRRVFYASNTVIFACIFLDYFLLLLMQYSFKKMKCDFSKDVEVKIADSADNKSRVIKDINRILKERLNLKLFGLVDFSFWNFLIIQLIMLLTIAIIILYQYFNDQILALTQLVESDDED